MMEKNFIVIVVSVPLPLHSFIVCVFDEVYSHLYCFIAGDHLEVCPHGSTCCTRDMEGKLKALSAREYSNIIGDAFRYAKNTFITRTRKFDGK